MTANAGIHVLTDARWTELEPLINAVRPPCKVPHEDLRQTIEAILWRHQNGAKWRAHPRRTRPLVAGGADRLTQCVRPAGLILVSGSACSTWSSNAALPSA